MARFDLREINPAAEGVGYGHQDVIDIRTQAQLEMLRYHRRACWCHEQMVTLALVWALLAAFFGISDYLVAFMEWGVLAILGGVVLALRNGTRRLHEAYRHCQEVNRSFSEVSVEHYSQIDQLCQQSRVVARYVDAIAESGRVLTYYELGQLSRWVEEHCSEARGRSIWARLMGLGGSISRRQHATGRQRQAT